MDYNNNQRGTTTPAYYTRPTTRSLRKTSLDGECKTGVVHSVGWSSHLPGEDLHTNRITDAGRVLKLKVSGIRSQMQDESIKGAKGRSSWFRGTRAGVVTSDHSHLSVNAIPANSRTTRQSTRRQSAYTTDTGCNSGEDCVMTPSLNLFKSPANRSALFTDLADMGHTNREELPATEYASKKAVTSLNSPDSPYSEHSPACVPTSHSAKRDRDIRKSQLSAAKKSTRESKMRAQKVEIGSAGHYWGQDDGGRRGLRFAACTNNPNTRPSSLKTTDTLHQGQNTGGQHNNCWQYPPQGRAMHRSQYAILDLSTQVTRSVNEGINGAGLEQEEDFKIWRDFVTKVKATRVEK